MHGPVATVRRAAAPAYCRRMPSREEPPSRCRSFRDVDAPADPFSLRAYLDLAELPVVAREKLRSMALLHLAPGAACLDVGSGAGPELGMAAAAANTPRRSAADAAPRGGSGR